MREPERPVERSGAAEAVRGSLANWYRRLERAAEELKQKGQPPGAGGQSPVSGPSGASAPSLPLRAQPPSAHPVETVVRPSPLRPSLAPPAASAGAPRIRSMLTRPTIAPGAEIPSHAPAAPAADLNVPLPAGPAPYAAGAADVSAGMPGVVPAAAVDPPAAVRGAAGQLAFPDAGAALPAAVLPPAAQVATAAETVAAGAAVHHLPDRVRALLVAPDEDVAQRYYARPFRETRTELVERLLDPPLTLEETARVLNVCPMTVRRYANRGLLPHFRTPGRQRRFRLSAVLALLEGQHPEGEGEPA